ncbi:transposase [Stygiobacter electus]|uniref:Transposase IS200-like domain-containing protein n=1 Tax=Stygiobacter electus TaxID=3032292 RepID=A0AAE3P2A8_9BACT|nr:transposase [Stygiobacter electus]MDF1611530.1 hypothetical protein [Stygiobacter electus]
MSKFKNTFRIESTRLINWDYSTPWWYLVTINTKNHIEFFGKVVNDKMYLNELGKIVDKFWEEIPNHFKNVGLDYYVIMPNHIHGIIIINPIVETGYIPSQDKQSETPYMASLPLGDIVGKFKAAVTRWAYKNGYSNFKWQSRFYDRIIRNENELFNIRRYIEQNPLKWELEKDKPENIFDL